MTHDGERPAAEKEWRRDGADGPAPLSTAACSGGTAAVRGGREGLVTSSACRAPSARTDECRDDLRYTDALAASGASDRASGEPATGDVSVGAQDAADASGIADPPEDHRRGRIYAGDWSAGGESRRAEQGRRLHQQRGEPRPQGGRADERRHSLEGGAPSQDAGAQGEQGRHRLGGGGLRDAEGDQLLQGSRRGRQRPLPPHHQQRGEPRPQGGRADERRHSLEGGAPSQDAGAQGEQGRHRLGGGGLRDAEGDQLLQGSRRGRQRPLPPEAGRRGPHAARGGAEDATAASQPKRRRRDDPVRAPPSVWTRPPQWLYLPHQGCVGGEFVSYATDAVVVADARAQGDVEAHSGGARRADGADGSAHIAGGASSQGSGSSIGGAPRTSGRISGRGPALGRGGSRAQIVDTAASVQGGQASIRGRGDALGNAASVLGAPGSVAAARVPRTANEIREEGHRREVASRGLTRYFSDIAENAARRAAASADAENAIRVPASERMAALRRRVLARTAADGTGDSGGALRTTEAGGGAARLGLAASPSNEDVKMHHSGEVEDPRGAIREAAAGVVPISGAVAAAASSVAWHTDAERPVEPP